MTVKQFASRSGPESASRTHASITAFGKKTTKLFACWVIFHDLIVVCWIFSKLTFFKKISGKLSECKTVCIQIRTDILSVLIWVQTLCKGYQQTTKVAASKERVKTKMTGSLSECFPVSEMWFADKIFMFSL